MKEAILIPLRLHIVGLNELRRLASRCKKDPGFKTHPQILSEGKAQVSEALDLLHEMEDTERTAVFSTLRDGGGARASQLHVGRMAQLGTGKRWCY